MWAGSLQYMKINSIKIRNRNNGNDTNNNYFLQFKFTLGCKMVYYCYQAWRKNKDLKSLFQRERKKERKIFRKQDEHFTLSVLQSLTTHSEFDFANPSDLHFLGLAVEGTAVFLINKSSEKKPNCILF